VETVIFVIVSIGVIAILGSNVLVVVSTTNYGKTIEQKTVAGTSIVMIFKLAAALMYRLGLSLYWRVALFG